MSYTVTAVIDESVVVDENPSDRELFESTENVLLLDKVKILELELSVARKQTIRSVDITLYRSMIGCLLYLTANCPDIAFSVGVCSRFQSNHKVSHLNTVKRIIKYVSGTCDYELFYSKESNLSLVGFSDSDWVGNADDKKSTIGGCFYVGANLVAWMSKKQNSVSLSIA
ncbi:secreted RxLR effector protein 161-like [Quercus lobata]|uniref:secreted RxLR effector protein 161-like n=1 Tax=Quercus lobata TaxID=97700 RepID=UPI001245C3CC|nr:secreted RxLR effector protein 161-like [Quercus lobata]